MCFTVAIHATREEIESRFKARFLAGDEFTPGYYFSAFTLPLLPVITGQEENTIDLFHWGLIPFWVKDSASADSIRTKTFNAKAETLIEKPSFRNAVKSKRCLVISKGFFEWQSRQNEKIPHFIQLKGEEPFAFAGLYDNWHDPETGEIHNTFTIITTIASPLLAQIHNTKKRMPVILPKEVERDWIDPDRQLDRALELLVPVDDAELSAHTVSKLVSKQGVDRNVPEVIKPFDYSGSSLF
ncbi:MAG: SOS response-associated peptidase [Bacteroidales bacterium]|nr:SOS response-associated peptidase [Bacteroidales bacterium]